MIEGVMLGVNQRFQYFSDYYKNSNLFPKTFYLGSTLIASMQSGIARSLRDITLPYNIKDKYILAQIPASSETVEFHIIDEYVDIIKSGVSNYKITDTSQVTLTIDIDTDKNIHYEKVIGITDGNKTRVTGSNDYFLSVFTFQTHKEFQEWLRFIYPYQCGLVDEEISNILNFNSIQDVITNNSITGRIKTFSSDKGFVDSFKEQLLNEGHLTDDVGAFPKTFNLSGIASPSSGGGFRDLTDVIKDGFYWNVLLPEFSTNKSIRMTFFENDETVEIHVVDKYKSVIDSNYHKKSTQPNTNENHIISIADTTIIDDYAILIIGKSPQYRTDIVRSEFTFNSRENLRDWFSVYYKESPPALETDTSQDIQFELSSVTSQLYLSSASVAPSVSSRRSVDKSNDDGTEDTATEDRIPLATILANEFTNNEDLDGNCLIYGKDFKITKDDFAPPLIPIVLIGLEDNPDWKDPPISLRWDEYLEKYKVFKGSTQECMSLGGVVETLQKMGDAWAAQTVTPQESIFINGNKSNIPGALPQIEEYLINIHVPNMNSVLYESNDTLVNKVKKLKEYFVDIPDFEEFLTTNLEQVFDGIIQRNLAISSMQSIFDQIKSNPLLEPYYSYVTSVSDVLSQDDIADGDLDMIKSIYESFVDLNLGEEYLYEEFLDQQQETINNNFHRHFTGHFNMYLWIISAYPSKPEEYSRNFYNLFFVGSRPTLGLITYFEENKDKFTGDRSNYQAYITEMRTAWNSIVHGEKIANVNNLQPDQFEALAAKIHEVYEKHKPIFTEPNAAILYYAHTS